MSKMGEMLLTIQDYVDANRESMTKNQILNAVDQRYGVMFGDIAEEYYNDSLDPEDAYKYAEVYDVDGYEQLCDELTQAGVIQ